MSNHNHQRQLNHKIPQLDEDDLPMTLHEHLVVEETARRLYIIAVSVRTPTHGACLTHACEAYRKAMDFMIVARMFDRMHPNSAATCPSPMAYDDDIDHDLTP